MHPQRDGTLPPPLSSHMIKHHLRFRNVTTLTEGGEKDRESRLQGALEYELGDSVRGIVEAARHNDLKTLLKTLPYLRHVTQDHYLELLNEPLNAATYANNPDCVAELIQWGADTNRLFNGEPASVVAASAGNLETLNVIMKCGCDLDRQSELGFTPLMKACEHGHNEIARALIDAGADRDVKSISAGLTALMIAAQRGNALLCHALLEPETSTGTPGCAKDVKELTLGYSALVFAARRDFIHVVELLAHQGVDLHSTDKQGMTACHHAAHFNRMKTFHYLWTFVGCVNAKDNKGRTPLMIAVQRGQRTLVELCVGLDLNNKQEEKEEQNEGDYIRAQRDVAEKIEMNSQDNEGRTALMYAVLNSCHLLVPLLMVEGGASLEQQDLYDKTAYDYAEELKLPEMSILLTNCVASRELRVLQDEARRLRAEKEAEKAARRAELSGSEFDFTSSEEDDDD